MYGLVQSKKLPVLGTKKSHLTNQHTVNLCKKTYEFPSQDNSNEKPKEYSLVPQENLKIPKFYQINTEEVEYAYYDQSIFDTLDKGETSHIKFSEKSKKIAFQRRASQENSQHNAEVTPKTERINQPSQIEQIRKVTKIKPDIQRSLKSVLQKSTSTGSILKEIPQSQTGSLIYKQAADEKVCIIQSKEENMLKTILRSTGQQLRKKELLKQRQEQTKRYIPVVYNMNTFKDIVREVQCYDDFRLIPFPPNFCPRTRCDYFQNSDDLFINRELQMDLGWAITPLSYGKQTHRKKISSFIRPQSSINNFASLSSSIQQENFDKENIYHKQHSLLPKISKYIQSKKQFCQQLATPPKGKFKNSIYVEKHASSGETVFTDQILSQEFDIFRQRISTTHVHSRNRSLQLNNSRLDGKKQITYERSLTPNVQYQTQERVIKDPKTMNIVQFNQRRKKSFVMMNVFHPTHLQHPSVPPSIQSSFSSVQLN